MESDDDDALLARSAAGDRRAFAALVSRHAERVRALAHRFTGNAADADDVAQGVFLAAWKEAPRWQAGRAQFTTWLHRVTVNRCIDHGRRRRFRAWIGLDGVAEPADGRADAAEIAEQRSELAAVRADIAMLPAKQRAALILAVDGDAGTASIAAALDVSEGAAEQLLVRARRKLRDQMRERLRRETVVGTPRAGENR